MSRCSIDNDNLVLQMLSKSGFAPGAIPLSSVSTKSWLRHRLALKTPRARVNKEECDGSAACDCLSPPQ